MEWVNLGVSPFKMYMEKKKRRMKDPSLPPHKQSSSLCDGCASPGLASNTVYTQHIAHSSCNLLYKSIMWPCSWTFCALWSLYGATALESISKSTPPSFIVVFLISYSPPLKIR